MSKKSKQPPLTPESAWKQLEGIWVHKRMLSRNLWIESRHEFTPDYLWFSTNIVRGGTSSQPESVQIMTVISDVEVEGQDILLTMGKKSNPEGVVCVRFRDPNRIIIEVGRVHVRFVEPATSSV